MILRRRRRRRRMISPVGSTISKLRSPGPACGRSASRAATSRSCRSARRPASTGTRPGRPGRSAPCGRSCSFSLSMLMPGPTVTVRSTRSISWIWFIRLTSTRIPPLQRYGAVGEAGAAGPRHHRDRAALASWTTSGDLLGRASAARPRRACAPPTGAPGTARARARGCSAPSCDRSARAASPTICAELVDAAVVERRAVATSVRPAATSSAGSDSIPARLARPARCRSHHRRCRCWPRPARPAAAPTRRTR